MALSPGFEYMPKFSTNGEFTIKYLEDNIDISYWQKYSFNEMVVKYDFDYEFVYENSMMKHESSIRTEGPWGKCGLKGKAKIQLNPILPFSNLDAELAIDDTTGAVSGGKLSVSMVNGFDSNAETSKWDCNLKVNSPYFDNLNIQTTLLIESNFEPYGTKIKPTIIMKIGTHDIKAELLLHENFMKIPSDMRTVEISGDLSAPTLLNSDQKFKLSGNLNLIDPLINIDLSWNNDLKMKTEIRWIQGKSASLNKELNWFSTVYKTNGFIKWEKELEIEFNLIKNQDKLVHFKGTFKNDEKISSIVLQWKDMLIYPNDKIDILLTGTLDKVNTKWTTEFTFNEKLVKMNGQYKCNSVTSLWEDPDYTNSKCMVMYQLENNVIQNFKNFELNGNYDSTQPDKLEFNFEGKSNNEQNTVLLKTSISPVQGFLEFEANLPALKIAKRIIKTK